MVIFRTLFQLFKLPFGGRISLLGLLGWKAKLLLVLGLAMVISQKLPGETLDCATPPEGLLISPCEENVVVRLRVLPDDAGTDAPRQVTVAGTYSSGDRFGIEGLAIRDGAIISKRFQGWDGVLVLDPQAGLQLFNAENVAVRDEVFNLKIQQERARFLDCARLYKLSVLQSHLLISDGMLDLSDVEDAPLFKRRMLFVDKMGRSGLYETAVALTLYDAAVELQGLIDPAMVFNLDMGAYDYCRRINNGDVSDCGALLVPEARLTNLLEFSLGTAE